MFIAATAAERCPSLHPSTCSHSEGTERAEDVSEELEADSSSSPAALWHHLRLYKQTSCDPAAFKPIQPEPFNVLGADAQTNSLLGRPPLHTCSAHLFCHFARFPVRLGVVHRSPDPLHQLVQLDRGFHQHRAKPMSAVLHTKMLSALIQYLSRKRNMEVYF